MPAIGQKAVAINKPRLSVVKKAKLFESNIITSTEDMPREEWLKWRDKGIGGSDASVVCGINKYKSPVELWLEKTGQIEQSEANEAAYWGNVMEPITRSEFKLRTGLKVDIVKYLLQHPQHKFMLANLDGVVNHPEYGNCIFEAKTASSFKANEWEDDIPQEYQLQIQHYMAVTGLKYTFVAVLIGGNQFKWKLIARDDEIIDMLIKLESTFWQHVMSNSPPPLDGSEASSNLLDGLFPYGCNKEIIMLPDAASQYIQDYSDWQEKEKLAAENKELAINRLKELLGEHQCGKAGDNIVSWKDVSTERLDSKRLKQNLPEIYTQYLSTSNYRRFNIK